MSLKVLIYNIYKLLWRAKTAQQPVNSHSTAMPKSKGGRPPVAFDEAEAMRLRRQGWSDHRIARHTHVAPSTVGSRLRNFTPPIPPTPPPIPVRQVPVPARKLPVLPVVPKPPIIVAPVQQAPVPIQQVLALPPAPYGIDAIPNGAKTFFLVNRKANAELVMHLGQPAIGVERWHPEYASLPAFQAAERIWVVMNSGEDNSAFFKSIVANIWIREKCLVSVDNGATPNTQPLQVGNWVQNVAKYKLLMDRPPDGSRPKTDLSSFELIHNFQPLPLPIHTDKIAALCKRFEAETDELSGGLDWQH
jgi:hypothetical protein